MDMTFVMLFYILTSIVPANKDQFKVTAANPENKTETIILNFTRSSNEWRVVPSNQKDEDMFFYFKGKTAYIKPSASAAYEKVDLLEKTQIVPNHKKWSKVTEVAFKEKESDPRSESLVFLVVNKGKNKRIVKIDKTNHPELTEKEAPTMHLSWK
ncbi:hypothetical protein [uncultured Microscilla sp.]|uniref:hypothetical protein n=1 Tax=uncultured Microscilla sp. TaxID=432653 RepID=UPI00260FFA7C|nr:hypothetical protein [uncultured Microscilla sp.]